MVILGDCGSPDPGSNLGPGPKIYLFSILTHLYAAPLAIFLY